jgi:pimeloyl-ACP methyl ester carboxylesterase
MLRRRAVDRQLIPASADGNIPATSTGQRWRRFRRSSGGRKWLEGGACPWCHGVIAGLVHRQKNSGAARVKFVFLDAVSLSMSRYPAPIVRSKFSRRLATQLMAGSLISAGLLRTRSIEAAEQGDVTMALDAPPSRVRKAYANGPFGQIHYRYSGGRQSTETPLMCLHASPLSGIVYDYWLTEMGKDRFTVAPDTPGYGGSDTPQEPPLIADLADAMIGFMDSTDLHVVDVMGYHTGSLIAADLAVRYPDRVRAVVMISAPIFDEEIIEEYSSRIYNPPPEFADVLASTAESLRKDGRGMFRDMTDERYEDISIERLRHFRTGNWGFRAAFAYDLREVLPQIEQPILILNPEDDLWELTPLAKPFLRNGRIHDLPGWTHGHLDTHTEEMARIVRAFLAE